MVGVGGIDHGLGGARRLGQNLAVVQGAQDRLDAALACLRRACVRTYQTGYLVALRDQPLRDRTADVTGGAGNEDLQGFGPLFLGSGHF